MLLLAARCSTDGWDGQLLAAARCCPSHPSVHPTIPPFDRPSVRCVSEAQAAAGEREQAVAGERERAAAGERERAAAAEAHLETGSTSCEVNEDDEPRCQQYVR